MLTEHLADNEPVVDTAVLGAIGMLQRRPHWPVSGVAAAVDLSERQLRRRFETAVSFGPKRLGRILRLQRLLELIHAPPSSVVRVGNRSQLLRPAAHDQ